MASWVRAQKRGYINLHIRQDKHHPLRVGCPWASIGLLSSRQRYHLQLKVILFSETTLKREKKKEIQPGFESVSSKCLSDVLTIWATGTLAVEERIDGKDTIWLTYFDGNLWIILTEILQCQSFLPASHIHVCMQVKMEHECFTSLLREKASRRLHATPLATCRHSSRVLETASPALATSTMDVRSSLVERERLWRHLVARRGRERAREGNSIIPSPNLPPCYLLLSLHHLSLLQAYTT